MVNRKCIALALFVLGATSVEATTFPNNYAMQMTSHFDPSTGSAGTLYLNYHYTGTTQSTQMCNSPAHHTPHLSVQVLKSGVVKSTHNADGYGVTPCSQMDQTLSVAFDFGSDLCDLSLFADGTCTLVEQTDGITCSTAGAFVFFIQKVQFEIANTTSQILYNTNGVNSDGITFYDAISFCQAITSPPDFSGPDIVYQGVDPNGPYLRVQDVCWRFANIHSSFEGIPWSCANVPRYQYYSYLQIENIANAPGVCTNYDGGFFPSF